MVPGRCREPATRDDLYARRAHQGTPNEGEGSVKYLLIMQMNPDVMAALSEDDRSAIMNGHGEFMKTIQESGEMILTQALGDPVNSTVVRARDGVPAVTDGPYLEAKEFMGGYYLVDVENKERAIELALQIPDTKIDGLAIEVRPVMFTGGPDM
jgi:hypothetical protein